MTVGQRIEQKRKEKGLSMEALGEMLGVGRSAVNKWEKGYVQRISRSTILQMAKIFECDPAWLGGYTDNESERIINSYLEPTEEEKAEAEYGKRVEQALDFWDAYEQATPHDREVVDMLLKRKRPTP